jgi:hypothetical protein
VSKTSLFHGKWQAGLTARIVTPEILNITRGDASICAVDASGSRDTLGARVSRSVVSPPVTMPTILATGPSTHPSTYANPHVQVDTSAKASMSKPRKSRTCSKGNLCASRVPTCRSVDLFLFLQSGLYDTDPPLPSLFCRTTFPESV